jgi:hypothetical protein
MFASVAMTTETLVFPGGIIPFDSQAAISNASFDSASATLQLGGSGTLSTFRVAFGVATRRFCALQLMVDGVPQAPLTFSSAASFSNVASINGEALVTIPDNASIQVQVTSFAFCDIRSFDPGVAGARAYLTVMKIG